MTPVEPKPASSVVLIRPAANPAVSSEPLEVYLIRRNSKMRFLGGYYAFPGGKVEPADVAPESLGRCIGLSAAVAEGLLPSRDLPALAFWVAAIRELFEETGVLMAADAAGHPPDLSEPAVASRVKHCREAMVASARSLGELLAAEGWVLDLRSLRYLSHFITPSSSPIRFSARFFLSRLPPGQEPRLFLEETSEAFWIGPREGHQRFVAGELAMAEPAEYALAYLAQFESWDEVWSHHADGRHKFQGIVDRIEFYGQGYDWATASWKPGKPPWQV